MIYEPREDSFMLVEQVKNYCKGKKVLDMGAGFGILAETALKNGAYDVLAVDIHDESINFVKDKGIRAITSDLFKHVKEKFDLIVFNPPYLPELEGEDKETKRIVCGGKYGYEIIERFFNEVNNYLNENGQILIVFSSLTNKDKVDDIIKKNNLRFRLLEKEHYFFEDLYTYLVEKI